MYRGTKLVILNFCAFNPFSILDEGSKNLHKKLKNQKICRYIIPKLICELKKFMHLVNQR